MTFQIDQAVHTNWGPGNIISFPQEGLVTVDIWGDQGPMTMRLDQIEDFPART